MRERSGVGLGLALLSALTFATSGTFARPLVTGDWSAEMVVLARVGIAALVLAVPALLALRGRWPVLRRNASYRPRYSMEWLSRASALRIHHARPIVVNGIG